ncbi:hypothetical protein [Marinobacter sp. HN1S83]|uniref:hypothetical protein n=1 Tax=Marinobacter sp. HN1S83 TaxID=3382301 RepID=UPI00387B4139
MKDWFNETLVILAYSKRTQWAIVLGVVGFFGIQVWGNYNVSNFELSGPVSSITEVIKHKFLRQYDKVALGCLLSFWGTAITLYKKDRKRFYRSY